MKADEKKAADKKKADEKLAAEKKMAAEKEADAKKAEEKAAERKELVKVSKTVKVKETNEFHYQDKEGKMQKTTSYKVVGKKESILNMEKEAAENITNPKHFDYDPRFKIVK